MPVDVPHVQAPVVQHRDEQRGGSGVDVDGPAGVAAAVTDLLDHRLQVRLVVGYALGRDEGAVVVDDGNVVVLLAGCSARHEFGE